MLSDSAKVGMKKDSLLVGSFILLHVGARLFSASFEIAQHGSDWYQPAATTLALFWSSLDTETLIFYGTFKLVDCIGFNFRVFTLFPIF